MIFFSAGSSNEFTSRETYISERNKSKLLSIMFHTYNSFKESLIVSTKLNCDILNIKVRQKYYTTYIIHNVICRPHRLKLFSNWSKYNAKPSLNTKWRQISIGWFNFFEQRVGFHAYVITKFSLSLFNFFYCPNLTTAISISSKYLFWMERNLGCNRSKWNDIFLCVRLVQKMTYVGVLLIY